MATTKKNGADAIPGFDAVAASRRWRVNAGRRLSKMTFAQQQQYLRRATAELYAEGKRKRHAS